MPWRTTQVSGRAVGVAGRCARLGHEDLAAHPGAGLVDRVTRSLVLGPSRLEEVEDVLSARCRPQSEEPVIRIGEGPTTTDRHETRIAVLREDHGELSAAAASRSRPVNRARLSSAETFFSAAASRTRSRTLS